PDRGASHRPCRSGQQADRRRPRRRRGEGISGEMTAQQPNVVLIHGHDIGRWLSCYDLPNIPTPNLDGFARQGILFERAFATAPLCTPSRGSMLTGRLPHANGLNGLAHDSWLYFDDVRTLPEFLRQE